MLICSRNIVDTRTAEADKLPNAREVWPQLPWDPSIMLDLVHQAKNRLRTRSAEATSSGGRDLRL